MRDHVRAREMFGALAEQGVGPAQYLYAYMLIFGQGGPQNLEGGVGHLQLAVVRGNPAATKLMGDLYRRGDGVPPDSQQAAQYYQLAANQGHAPAQHALGAIYNQGTGLEEDPAEAARWFLRAASPYDDTLDSRRWERTSPAGPAPTIATWVSIDN